MPVNYTRLWKLLIDKHMNRSQLKEAAHISTNAVAKLGKNESVSLETLEKICRTLDCSIEQIVEFTSNEENTNQVDKINKIKAGTFSLNRGEPIHRWYSYVEGYSSCLVENEISALISKGINIESIYDPFGGTGTTNLVAAEHGIESFYSESNPFMQTVIDAKINVAREYISKYSVETLRHYIDLVRKLTTKEYKEWGGFEKYFDSKQLNQLLSIKALISEENEQIVKKILMLALSSITVKISKMIRRGDLRYATEKEYVELDVVEMFIEKLLDIIEDLEIYGNKISTSSTKVSEDARDNDYIDRFDCVFTSPPYLNGTNYIRNTKLELKLNDFVASEKDLPKFHSKGIIAGINNVSKRSGERPIIPEIEHLVVKLIETAYDDRIPKMVAGYFYDMNQVIEKLKISMKNDGIFIMDIGDSQFGGVHIKTHEILSKLAFKHGFVLYGEEILRERKSKNGMMLSQRLLKFKLKK